MEEKVFRFLGAVDMDQYRRIRESEIGNGLSYADILQLSIIGRNPGISVGDLGKELNLSRPATTQKVNELESKGLIEKHQSSVDKRMVYLQLSERLTKGCQKEYKNTKVAQLVKAVEKAFSLEERENFYTIMDFMTEYLLRKD